MNREEIRKPLVLTKERLDEVAALMVANEPRYKDSQLAKVTEGLVNAFDYYGGPRRHRFTAMDRPNWR